MANPLRSSAGFTYIAALVLVIIMGIMLGAAGQSWKRIADREREEELLFRGNQYRAAINLWYTPRPGQHVTTPLVDLKDLLKDPRSVAKVRYLRRLYKDPMTDKDWVIIKVPTGIIGVASSSEATPIKQGNFPIVNEIYKGTPRLDIYKQFEGKTKYSEWLFVYGPPPGLPPSGSIPGSSTGSMPGFMTGPMPGSPPSRPGG